MSNAETKNKFWRFSEDYDSDEEPFDYHKYLRNHFINGQIATVYRTPFVDCPICGVLGDSAYLPFECPPALRVITLLNNFCEFRERKCFLIDDYKEFIRDLEKKCIQDGFDLSRWRNNPVLGFVPGTRFADRIIEIPCHPSVSFFWEIVGFECVVTPEVKKLFEKESLTGVTFHQAKIGFIGRHDMKQGDPPEDVMATWDIDECVVGEPKTIPGEPSPEKFGPL